jgi:hypothetical protein
MLSVVAALLVSGAAYGLLFTTQRLTRTQSQQVALQSGVRAGALIVLNELGELGTVPGGAADQNDIVAMGATAITYRAMRGIGFVCHTDATPVIRLTRSSFSGHRDPQAGRDEAYVLIPGGSLPSAKEAWLPLQIVSVATATPCPAGQGPGITMSVSAHPSLGVVEAGTPVRITELMELRQYRSDGRSWLGARSVGTGEAIQPLLGPLADTAGFQLEYLDGSGAITLDRTAVKSIRVRLRGRMERGSSPAIAPEEELVTHVALRNSMGS